VRDAGLVPLRGTLVRERCRAIVETRWDGGWQDA
jgi:hypothetical protein